jgi:hypothetical protein
MSMSEKVLQMEREHKGNESKRVTNIQRDAEKPKSYGGSSLQRKQREIGISSL